MWDQIVTVMRHTRRGGSRRDPFMVGPRVCYCGQEIKNNACMTSVDRSIRFAWWCMKRDATQPVSSFWVWALPTVAPFNYKVAIIFRCTLRSIGHDRCLTVIVSVNFLRRKENVFEFKNTYFNISTGCKPMDRTDLGLTNLFIESLLFLKRFVWKIPTLQCN